MHVSHCRFAYILYNLVLLVLFVSFFNLFVTDFFPLSFQALMLAESRNAFPSWLMKEKVIYFCPEMSLFIDMFGAVHNFRRYEVMLEELLVFFPE